jgi:L-rhamnose 1-dehydrogenase
MRLRDKVSIVTGGSRGIGRAICKKFASEGAKVVANYSKDADRGNYRNAADLLVEEIMRQSGEAVAFEADVSDKVAVDEMVNFAVDKYGKLDIMVANAGICPFKEFLDIDEVLLDRVTAVNQKGAFFCAQAALRTMVEKDIAGRIIFTSSVSSIFGGELQTHYCATKGAVNQLMKSVAIAVGKYGITANAVLPGTVITDINRKQLEEESPELKEYFIRRTPLRRLATAEDVANAVLFFASDEAACISGSILVVDGGMSVNLQ